MSESKPTAAAIRAVLAVSDAVALNPKLGFRERAEIIDRETGLPELLEACKGICEAVADCLPISDEPKRVDVLYHKAKLMAIDAAAAKCSAAILKAERKT